MQTSHHHTWRENLLRKHGWFFFICTGKQTFQEKVTFCRPPTSEPEQQWISWSPYFLCFFLVFFWRRWKEKCFWEIFSILKNRSCCKFWYWPFHAGASLSPECGLWLSSYARLHSPWSRLCSHCWASQAYARTGRLTQKLGLVASKKRTQGVNGRDDSWLT